MKIITSASSLSRACTLLALAVFTPLITLAQTTFTWSGSSDSTWDTAANWSPVGGPPGTTVTDVAQFNADVTNEAVTLGSATTIGQLVFASGAGSYAFSGAALTISAVSGSTFINNSSDALQTFSNNVTLSLPTGTSSTINVSSGSTLTFSGKLTLTTGSTYPNLILSGGGTVNLTGTVSGINQLQAGAGTTLNWNTTSSSGVNNPVASAGGRINFLSTTGTTGVSLTLAGNGSEMSIAKAGLTIGAQYLKFTGNVSNSTETFGADFSGTGTATYSGQVQLNNTSGSVGTNNTYSLSASANNTLVFSGAIIDSNASGSGTKVLVSGPGIIKYSGSSANTSVTPIVVDTGATLVLAKTAGVDAIGGGSVTVNTGGHLQLAASNQINDAVTLSFAGGTFNVGAFIESLGALTVGADGGTLDFSGSAGSVTFASLSSITGTLTITGWTPGATISFTDGTAWDSTALSHVDFVGYGAAEFSDGMLIASAIPEPATTGLLLGLASLFGCRLLRRRAHASLAD